MTITDFFRENSKAALGFSGGVDSAYLLWAGIQSGVDIRPYYIKTAFQPEFELQDAKRLTKQFSMVVILGIQCLFFADGGLLALGANCWNMAFSGCFVGYYLIWRPIMQRRT